MQASRISLAALVLVTACRGSGKDVKLERLERPGFAIHMPAWKVASDEDGGASGKYKVGGKTQAAEVGWQYGEPLSMAELEHIADTIGPAVGMEELVRRAEELPGQRRLHVTMTVERKAWLAMSLIECTEIGVMVTVGVSALRRDFVTSLRDRLLATFECREGQAPPQVQVWPTTDLPDEFGIIEDNALLLAHQDGRWLVVIAGPASTVEDSYRSGENQARLLRVYGELFESRFVGAGPTTRARTLTGDLAWVRRINATPQGAMALSAFTCPKIATGYLVFAGDDSGASGHEPLEALSLRLGCPGEGARPIGDRPSTCAVGALAYCDEAQERAGGDPPPGD